MVSAGLLTLAVAARFLEPGGRPRRRGAAADEDAAFRGAALRVVVRLRAVLAAFRVDLVAALARRAVVLRRRVVARLVAGAVLSLAALVCSAIYCLPNLRHVGIFHEHNHSRRNLLAAFRKLCPPDVSPTASAWSFLPTNWPGESHRFGVLKWTAGAHPRGSMRRTESRSG
jgi:hypothetical protein